MVSKAHSSDFPSTSLFTSHCTGPLPPPVCPNAGVSPQSMDHFYAHAHSIGDVTWTHGFKCHADDMASR